MPRASTLPLVLAAGLWGLALAGAGPAPRVRNACPALAAGDPVRLLYGGALDLNRAGEDALTVLPGIGAVRARAIAQARPFASLAELEEVPGIGPATRAGLAGWVRLGSPAGSEKRAESLCPFSESE